MVLVDDKSDYRMTGNRLYNSLIMQHTAAKLPFLGELDEHPWSAFSLLKLRGLIELLIHRPELLEHLSEVCRGQQRLSSCCSKASLHSASLKRDLLRIAGPPSKRRSSTTWDSVFPEAASNFTVSSLKIQAPSGSNDFFAYLVEGPGR